MNVTDWRKSKNSHRGQSSAAAGVLLAFFAAAVPVHAAGYMQTNLVASTDAYGASIVDPSLINAWGIAIRPAGLGGHFWVESNGGGTTNQFIGDGGRRPLFADDLRLVTVPGPELEMPFLPEHRPAWSSTPVHNSPSPRDPSPNRQSLFS